MLEELSTVRLVSGPHGGPVSESADKIMECVDSLVSASALLEAQTALPGAPSEMGARMGVWEIEAAKALLAFSEACTMVEDWAESSGVLFSELEERESFAPSKSFEDREVYESAGQMVQSMYWAKEAIAGGVEDCIGSRTVTEALHSWDTLREHVVDLFCVSAVLAERVNELSRRLHEGGGPSVYMACEWISESSGGRSFIHNPFTAFSPDADELEKEVDDEIDESSVQYGEYTGSYPSRIDGKMRSEHVMALRQVAAKLGARLPKGAKASKIAYNQSNTRIALRVAKGGAMAPAENDAKPGKGEVVIHLIADRDGQFSWGVVKPGRGGTVRGQSKIGGAIQKITNPIKAELDKLSESDELDEAKKHAANTKYLASVDSRTKARILKAVADHYGISAKEAEDELTDPDAENVYEYLAANRSLAMQVLRDFKQKIKEDEDELDEAPDEETLAGQVGASIPMPFAVSVSRSGFDGRPKSGFGTVDGDEYDDDYDDDEDDDTDEEEMEESRPDPMESRAMSRLRDAIASVKRLMLRPDARGVKKAHDELKGALSFSAGKFQRGSGAAKARQVASRMMKGLEHLKRVEDGSNEFRMVAQNVALSASEADKLLYSMSEARKDSDGDGLPDELEKSKFTSKKNPNPEGNDRDGDGETNEPKPFEDVEEAQYGFGGRRIGGKARKPSFDPGEGKGSFYVQDFSGGETMWFYRVGTLKNGNATGYSIANFGRNRKPKKESIPRRDIPYGATLPSDAIGLWKKIDPKDIPSAVMAKLKAVMEGMEGEESDGDDFGLAEGDAHKTNVDALLKSLAKRKGLGVTMRASGYPTEVLREVQAKGWADAERGVLYITPKGQAEARKR